MPTAPQRRPQISLALMLLLMSIFAVMSAGMFYASRVGAVQADLALLSQSLPEQPQPPRRAQRATHLVFLMFTYTSPLLLAMLLGLLVKLPWFRQRGGRAAR